MDKESYSWGGIGFLALFFLIIFAFVGRGCNTFGGWGNNCGNCGHGDYAHYDFENFKATCDAEKSEIINTARTQYLIEQQAAVNREAAAANASVTNTKIDFYAYQGLRDQLAETQRENMMLQNQLFVKDQLAPVNATLASIQCQMLKRPEVTGLSTSCNPIVTPSLANIAGVGCCGCGTL
jgi:hypothetical protein